jgi:hypothetical protein
MGRQDYGKRFGMDPLKTAEDKFGTARVEELRSEIEQLTADIDKLRSFPLETDDEP